MNTVFKIYRFDPESGRNPRYQYFEIDVTKGQTVLDALIEIKAHKDGSLVFRRSCRSGICGSCAMQINGLNKLACETQVEDLKSKTVTIDPLPGFKPIKDLAVDMEPFYDKLRAVLPYLINPDSPPTDKERIQSPEEFKMIELATSCILCGGCTSSCPSFWADKAYLGPAALVKAYRYVFDTRDRGYSDRSGVVNNKHGLWRCHTIMNCNDACPKHIFPTEGISLLKRKVVEEKY
ncbi:succinate dehydrogenase iron-sulfur subunit [candidate division LCP-89 bacterium B3_LCP]|uniref:Fumarate reductase iron-sulfur subunit n=1 Tax=candidate division LCP-89 bacterium B3_LCP TaxID=2012998 RepID=A0A532UTV7_UNCL8|nr:MAG: succinate dehydrogenase iron-sulfur subunit [candidate division LCP-89 bacterium B3_LCP]